MVRLKQELPAHVKKEMDWWRLGLIPMPNSYKEFHKDLAKAELKRLETEEGVVVHKTWVDSDGWMDGMRVIWAIIEHKGELYKIHWNDGSQSFFRQSSSGGSFTLHLV